MIEDTNRISELTSEVCHDQFGLAYFTLFGKDSSTHECAIYATILKVTKVLIGFII